MRSFTNYLSTIISKDYHYSLTDSNTLRLIEGKTKQSIDINLSNSDQVFCFSIDKDRMKKDKGDPIFPFFNPEIKGLCCKNDFILVCQYGKKITVFLIELKSKSTKGYISQLQSGKLFFQFVLSRTLLCNDDFLEINQNLNYKCILFRDPRKVSSKGTSRHRKLDFIEEQGLMVTKQSYETPYYLSQFL